jgi:hypothetical protein
MAMLWACGQSWAMTFSFTFSGELDTSSPTFLNPDTGLPDPAFFQTFEFNVPETGEYHILSFYDGDPATGEYLDGFLALYEAFPGSSIVFNDNYSAGGIAALSEFDDACFGQNCSAFSVFLTAGFTYQLLQTSFTGSPHLQGFPTGSYETTIVGPGQLVTLPLPAALWLFGSGLAGLACFRGCAI